MKETLSALQEAQMLHPMTLVQRFLLNTPAIIILIFPVLRSPETSQLVPIFIAVLYGLLALPLIFLSYYRFRYRITPKEIFIHSGVINRQHRSIPLERIQNIVIEQSLLPRLFRTAKVKIETAGSAQTEGVLEFVSLERAHAIREIVRIYQDQQKAASIQEVMVDDPAEAPEAPQPISTTAEPEPLYQMPLSRVLLYGMMRFSLLYIALAFSALQQLNPDPDEIEIWLTRGWLRPLAEFAMGNPILLTGIAISLAALLSWLTGILVSLNRYYKFAIWRADAKLHRRHGLLTLAEGTIPLKRVQALIMRANPVMRRFGWSSLHLQTMGVEAGQKGQQMAAPLIHADEVEPFASNIHPISLPDAFHRVSPLTIRRFIIRSNVLLTATILPIMPFWQPVLWGFGLIPFIFYYSFLRYRNHGYFVGDNVLYVRRGVLHRYTWAIPINKFQVFYTRSSFFQRRLKLCTFYTDTAGVNGLAASPEVIDLPEEEAAEILDQLYTKFQQAFAAPKERQADSGTSDSLRIEQSPR